MCDNFKCYSLNVVHASSQVGMDAELYFTLVSLLFSAISISIFNIIFTLVSVVFLNPSMDFDSVFKLLKYAGTCMCVQDGGTR